MIKNKLWIIILCLCYGNTSLLAQQKDSIKNTDYPVEQVDASYKGGLCAMVLFIDKNIQLPAAKKGLKKTVLINIEIDEEGNITNASMLSGVNKVIDQSIIDVIKKMPPWQPASANGIPIPSRQVIGYNISY
ncbi:MAG TPA: energy transducer TonB [Bacteroidales bacterium]|nr:energy transducer TonB [Bacteroidales bacterium]